MRRFFLPLCYCLLASCVAFSQTAQPADEAKTGLAIGNKAPQFTLKDQTGKPRQLSEFLNQGNKVALVFYRSASW